MTMDKKMTSDRGAYDQRPPFARFLWRDRTQEHWGTSIAVDIVSLALRCCIYVGLAYLTVDSWVPAVVNFVCR